MVQDKVEEQQKEKALNADKEKKASQGNLGGIALTILMKQSTYAIETMDGGFHVAGSSSKADLLEHDFWHVLVLNIHLVVQDLVLTLISNPPWNLLACMNMILLIFIDIIIPQSAFFMNNVDMVDALYCTRTF